MSTEGETRNRPKVLVCDDDSSVRMLTRQCLEADKMVVVEAASGPEAIAQFVAERPDLLFLDVEMPGMDGLEVCRRIRDLPQGATIPIMIVTGSDDRKSIDEGFDAGATQYKTKPVNWSLLSRDVQYMLRASNAFTALKRQEDRLRYLAYFDPLTNLPNRRSFTEQLNRILKRSQRREHDSALLFIDLDNFKRINVLITPEQHRRVTNAGLNMSGLLRGLLDDHFSDEKVVFSMSPRVKDVYNRVISNFGAGEADLEPEQWRLDLHACSAGRERSADQAAVILANRR